MSWRKVEAILKRPFDDHEINWMPKSTSKDGRKIQLLAYMDARGVRDRLDEAFGPNWKTTYKPGPQGGVVCCLSIKWEGEWRGREGGADNTQIEAVKGGLSDAEKRAATEWGIGRHLYDLGGTWVSLQEKADYSVPEGRRVYAKGKHAVAPSIRKLQPDLFKKKETKDQPKEQPKEQKNWDTVRAAGRNGLFDSECKKLDLEPELGAWMVKKMSGKWPDELEVPRLNKAVDWLKSLDKEELGRWHADFLDLGGE